MFFIHILIILHGVSFRIIDAINERLTISLYLDAAYNKNSLEVIGLQNDIKNTIPSISIRYKTKEEVLEDVRLRDPELVGILEIQNPLPETITLENIPLKQYEILNTLIEKRLYILLEREVDDSQEYFSTYTKQFERIERVIQVLQVLQIWLYVIITTFVISIAIIVYSIIGNFIYYYRDEIYITRLVGGSKVFIYGPFSFQWMLYVGIAFLLSTALFFLLLHNVQYVFDIGEIGNLYQGNIFLIVWVQGLLFLFIGAMSGFLSSQKYITKK